jgi:outer membrane receptor for ferric coprogen and ferric-rhodotorulic acid
MYGPNCNPVLGGTDCASYPATPKPSRRYDGVELRAESRLMKNWQSVFSYTVSRLSGYYSGLSSTDTNQATPNWTPYYDAPFAYVDAKGRYIDGPLPTDRTHTFKYYGAYRIPFGRHSLTVGGVFTAGSGIPMTRVVSVLNNGVFVDNRNSEGRRGAYSLTNLYVAQDFKLTEHGTLRLDFNLNNAFNQSTALSYAVNYTRNSIAVGIPGSSIQTNLDATKGFDYLKQIELQANYNRPASCGSFSADPYCPSAAMRLDPTFMKANVFQTPLAGRFGVRFMF